MNSLVDYSSSDESEGEIPQETQKTNVQRPQLNKKPLPLPDDIKKLFSEDEKPRDDPSQHGGRQRSFAHLEGNWATLVYIPYEPEDEFFHLQEQLLLCLRPLEFRPMDDYHVSLSRSVPIRHHWMQEMKENMKVEFARLDKCACEVIGVKVFTNDEKTRSFLVLQVTTGDDTLESYVKVVDTCFHGYKLEKYYQPPSFHVSIAWCLGDVSEQVTQKIKCKLKETMDSALDEDSELKYFAVEEVRMKTGNKEFRFQLR